MERLLTRIWALTILSHKILRSDMHLFATKAVPYYVQWINEHYCSVTNADVQGYPVHDCRGAIFQGKGLLRRM